MLVAVSDVSLSWRDSLCRTSSNVQFHHCMSNIWRFLRFGHTGKLAQFGNTDGLYLIRERETNMVPPCEPFGLSVMYQRKINHYKVAKFPSQKYGIQDGLRYLTMREVSLPRKSLNRELSMEAKEKKRALHNGGPSGEK